MAELGRSRVVAVRSAKQAGVKSGAFPGVRPPSSRLEVRPPLPPRP